MLGLLGPLIPALTRDDVSVAVAIQIRESARLVSSHIEGVLSKRHFIRHLGESGRGQDPRQYKPSQTFQNII